MPMVHVQETQGSLSFHSPGHELSGDEKGNKPTLAVKYSLL